MRQQCFKQANVLLRQYAVLLVMLLHGIAFGQDSDRSYPEITGTYYIQNATITVKPGEVLEKAAILIEDGLIRHVGDMEDIPAHARVIEADSMYVYAGFIDGLSHTGIPEKEDSGDRNNQERVKTPGSPPDDRAGITPQNAVRDQLTPKDNSIPKLREQGFTMAQIVPRGRMLPGQGSVIALHGNTPGDMIVVEDHCVFSQLSGARRMYPSTVIGVMAKWRDLYRQTAYYKEHRAQFEKGGMMRPGAHPVREALIPVVNREKPVLFVAENVKALHRVFQLQEDLGFDLVLAGVKQGWYVRQTLSEKKIPLYLSLDLPEEQEKDAKKTSADSTGTRERDQPDPFEKEKKALRKRQEESIQDHLRQAAVLEEAGIPFGFCTLGIKPKDIRKNLRTLIRHGLSEEGALAALTTTPARFMGIDRYAGTVEEGKLAHLTILTKPLSDEKARVRYVFVDGHPYPFEIKQEKDKGSKSTGGNVTLPGSWSYEVATEDATEAGMLVFSGTPGNYTGMLTRANTSEKTGLSDIEVSGNRVTFKSSVTLDGSPVHLAFNILVDGKSFEGLVTVGTLGSYAIEGEKERDPDQ